jgi:hypothetical protein
MHSRDLGSSRVSRVGKCNTRILRIFWFGGHGLGYRWTWAKAQAGDHKASSGSRKRGSNKNRTEILLLPGFFFLHL